jgi:hypothetical protein
VSRIVVGSYLFRYPLGGMVSWVLQYLVGFQRLGHDVWFVEKAGYPDACFDPSAGTTGDDPSYAIRQLVPLLARFGLEDRWCFVDVAGRYHGARRAAIEEVIRSADVFVDMGTHGSWAEECAGGPLRVLIDGEPGFTQTKLRDRAADYDRWFTTGANVGTPGCPVPTAGRRWEHVFHPVVADLFAVTPPPRDAPYTTVMNWRSHGEIEHEGSTYGQKDRSFPCFEDLHTRTSAAVEVAVAGDAPRAELERLGWRVRPAHATTISFDAFAEYVRSSRGELGVCKHAFVALQTGWFSDRSAAYLASGRPVVLQDTGFGQHLPTGEGLFAVRDATEAAAAIETIEASYRKQSAAARAIAEDVLDAPVVLSRFLEQLAVRPSPAPA